MIYLPFLPLAIGALLEAFGIHGGLVFGMIGSMVVIALGMIVMTCKAGGVLHVFGAISFAVVIALGVEALDRHDASPKRDATSIQTSDHQRR